jgi:hypothetical protein
MSRERARFLGIFRSESDAQLPRYRTRSRQAGRANSEPTCSRRMKQPTWPGRALPGDRMSCTTRSTAPPRSQRCRASQAGRVVVSRASRFDTRKAEHTGVGEKNHDRGVWRVRSLTC